MPIYYRTIILGEVRTVQSVSSLSDFPYSTSLRFVKGVTTTMSQDQTNSPSEDGDSAPNVTWLLPMEVTGALESDFVSLKCTEEKKSTTHEYVKVTPLEPTGAANPMDLLKMTKRLLICTSCGTLRLTN